jgi:DNA replication and repair protein RecF
VSGELKDTDGNSNRVGVEKTTKSTRLRLNGEAVTVASKIAKLVPILTFNTDSYLLLDGGPANRRALLDRSLFHVEHHYLPVLKQYYRGLKQRNSLLRARARREQAEVWDHQIESCAERLDVWRRACIDHINRHVADSAINAVVGDIHLDYRRGWPAEVGIAATLAENWSRDRETGTTTVGPHRAELRIKVGEKLAKTVVSRGQGKLIIAALVGAQARYLREHAHETPILLVDDLASELDTAARDLAIEALLDTQAQIFFTAIDPSDLPGSLCRKTRMFHVEHGVVRSQAQGDE